MSTCKNSDWVIDLRGLPYPVKVEMLRCLHCRNSSYNEDEILLREGKKEEEKGEVERTEPLNSPFLRIQFMPFQ